MTRTGKIARLPMEVREELNRRLQDGEPGKALVGWLNGHPKVQAVIREQFGGCRISKSNLSRWKTGGYPEWRAEQKAQSQSREIIAEAKELAAATDRPITDHVSTILAAQYAVAMVEWQEGMSVELRQKLQALGKLTQDVSRLRRGDHDNAWMELERERTEWKNQAKELNAALEMDPREGAVAVSRT